MENSLTPMEIAQQLLRDVPKEKITYGGVLPTVPEGMCNYCKMNGIDQQMSLKYEQGTIYNWTTGEITRPYRTIYKCPNTKCNFFSYPTK